MKKMIFRDYRDNNKEKYMTLTANQLLIICNGKIIKHIKNKYTNFLFNNSIIKTKQFNGTLHYSYLNFGVFCTAFQKKL